jgi:methionyl-tRNA formyltransferase
VEQGETRGGERLTVRIVFWGSPEFALPSFRALIGEGHDVTGVVTQPDRPVGRHRELRAPPVKAAAHEEGIPVAQPERPVGDEFAQWLADRAPELNVVVAYGQILRREVLDAPERGSINLHASLLPELRGAAPVQWAVARGFDTTGVTVMQMVEALDAGPILLQVAEPIGPEETGTELMSRLSEIGAEVLVEALALIEADGLGAEPQDDAAASYAPRLTREHAHIDWDRDAPAVGCQIRAFDEVPGAWTRGPHEELKLFRPAPGRSTVEAAEPGTVLALAPDDPERGMLVACASGALWIREVQPAGRRRMTVPDWLRGRGIEEGARLT